MVKTLNVERRTVGYNKAGQDVEHPFYLMKAKGSKFWRCKGHSTVFLKVWAVYRGFAIGYIKGSVKCIEVVDTESDITFIRWTYSKL